MLNFSLQQVLLRGDWNKDNRKYDGFAANNPGL